MNAQELAAAPTSRQTATVKEVKDLEKEIGQHVGDMHRLRADFESFKREMQRQLFTSGGSASYIKPERLQNDINNQRVKIQDAGSDVGTRPTINIIAGSGITITITEDSDENRIDVEIALTP